jgi:addiction module HigA family antidote
MSGIKIIHPGEILREEYLMPLGMSAGALARQLRVRRTRIERIATEQARSPPIQLCAWPNFSTRRQNFG